MGTHPPPTAVHMNTLTDKIALRDRFRKVLIDATKCRDQKRAIMETTWGPEVEWVGYERAQMQAAVNFARAERGRAPVGIDAIRRVDQWATGHVDWLDKFSLYCAELVES